MANKFFYTVILLFFGVLSAGAQAVLQFRHADWDFGRIEEVQGKTSHTFVCVNRGSAPAVIADIVTTCGCTASEYSRQPILPGDSATVRVTYDPTGRPGTFIRELGVFGPRRERLATLTIRGEVTPRPRTIEERYPVDAGGGLRLSTDMHAFSYIYKGRPAQTAVGYVNTGSKPLRLAVGVEGDPFLRVEAPRTVAAGEEGEMQLLCLVPVASERYGSLHSALRFTVNGHPRAAAVNVYGIAVDDPEAGDPARAPHADPDPGYLRFGSVERHKGAQQERLTLSNTGTGPLTVRSVEYSSAAIASDILPGTVIEAGGERRFTVTFDPAQSSYGAAVGYLTLITDDPARPMRKIRITAIVEER